MENTTDLKVIEKSFEKSWNRIVNIIGEMLDVESALINKIDGSKIEILKAGGSYEKYFAENDVFDLTGAYCGEVAKNKEMLEINNAAKEEKWQGTPNLEIGLISYLGYPIFDSKDKVVGTICVEDNKERNFTQTEKDMLLQFKEVIENQINQLDLTKNLEKNIEKGKQIHEQYLPSQLPDIDDFSFGSYYQAADRLGGDFYDFIELEDNVVFYISDVSGHDLSGSMLNIFLKETINSYLINNNVSINKKLLSPSKILNYINNRYNEETFPDDYFISLIIGVINLDTKKMRFSNAGVQFSPLLLKKDNGVVSFKCGGMPISYLNFDNYEECKLTLNRGDAFFINTDGLLEQDNGEKMYGQKRLIELLNKVQGMTPDQIIEIINNDFNKFKGDLPVQDDITYLMFKYDE